MNKLAIYHTYSRNPQYEMKQLTEKLYEELVKNGVDMETDVERLGPLFEMPQPLTALTVEGQLHGFVVENILMSIDMSDVVIALEHGNDPDVMWQAGYAYATGKTVVVVSADELGNSMLALGSTIPHIPHIFEPEPLNVLTMLLMFEKSQTDAGYRYDNLAEL